MGILATSGNRALVSLKRFCVYCLSLKLGASLIISDYKTLHVSCVRRSIAHEIISIA